MKTGKTARSALSASTPFAAAYAASANSTLPNALSRLCARDNLSTRLAISRKFDASFRCADTFAASCARISAGSARGNLGVDAITSDQPDLLKQVLGE